MATDFARLDAMTDEDIDCSDIPALTEEQMQGGEGLWITPETEFMPLAIDKQALVYFRNTGKGYAMRLSKVINSFLKDYVTRKTSEGVI